MFFLKELPTREMMERYQAKFPAMDVDAVHGALRMMREASVLTRRLEAYFAEHELSLLRFLVLIVIDREPALPGLTHGQLAERLDVSKPVITRTLRRMERDGAIRVSPDASDKRCKRVELTGQGRKALHRLLPGYFEEIGQFMRRAPS